MMPLFIKVDLNADGLVTVKSSIAESVSGANFINVLAKGRTVSSALHNAAKKFQEYANSVLDSST
jgi:hypothetical protein